MTTYHITYGNNHFVEVTDSLDDAIGFLKAMTPPSKIEVVEMTQEEYDAIETQINVIHRKEIATEEIEKTCQCGREMTVKSFCRICDRDEL